MADKITREVAEAELERFAEKMDLDFDLKLMDAEDAGNFEKNKRVIIDAMVSGELVVNEAGEPVYTPKDGSGDIVFHEPGGSTFMAADTQKKDHNTAKMLAMVAEMTGERLARIVKLKNRDLRVVLAIGTLFFG